tara:strand:+ start:133 stop:375 length:243 start_codon:yes stop_codon:yes gene_type:complete
MFAFCQDGVETQVPEDLDGIAIIYAIHDRYHAAGSELFFSFVYAVFSQVCCSCLWDGICPDYGEEVFGRLHQAGNWRYRR